MHFKMIILSVSERLKFTFLDSQLIFSGTGNLQVLLIKQNRKIIHLINQNLDALSKQRTE